MRLEQPLWLLLLPVAILAAVLSHRFTEPRRAALAFPGLGALRLPAGSGALARLLPVAMKALVLALAAVALARPQRVERQDAGTALGVDIMLVLDTSTSMKALDFNPLDRMSAAKAAADRFVRGRVSDRIGVVVFGGETVLSCPLTLDYSAVLGFLQAVYPGMTESDGTAIGDGIAAGVNHLQESGAKSRVLILLTDGRSNAGLLDPVTAARAARATDIKVHVIGAGRRGEAVIPVSDPVHGTQLARIADDLDEETLLKVAAETGGRYFRVENISELDAVFREIDRMEKTELERPELVTYHDLHAWLLLPAALLLAGESLLARTLLLRLP